MLARSTHLVSCMTSLRAVLISFLLPFTHFASLHIFPHQSRTRLLVRRRRRRGQGQVPGNRVQMDRRRDDGCG